MNDLFQVETQATPARVINCERFLSDERPSKDCAAEGESLLPVHWRPSCLVCSQGNRNVLAFVCVACLKHLI